MGRVRSGSGVPQPDPRGFGLTKTQAQPNTLTLAIYSVESPRYPISLEIPTYSP
jgi:hypothetical protein